MNDPKNSKILLIDDNPAIHEDFEKILDSRDTGSNVLEGAKAAFFDEDRFGAVSPKPASERFELDFAVQGALGLDKVQSALAAGRPFALAFVDVRMPPGWDGIETIERLWRADPLLQVVICTAYADYSREEMIARLGPGDRLLILKKPFDPIEVVQLASTLTEKWNVAHREKLRIEEVKTYAASLERANRELAEARDHAETATRAKSEFLANMSHEIRTPMVAILGYGDMLVDPDLPRAEMLEHLDTIKRSGEHLLAVLDDILDLSRIEAGRIKLDRARCSPREILAEVRSLLEARASEKGLELAVQSDANLPEAVASDPVRIRQILLNLVGNAIKFTASGSVRLSASGDMRVATAGTSWQLRFEIQDTGIGMTPEQIGKLFTPFSQGDSSVTRRYGGNGLGLCVSKRLAQMLGGDIAVESEIGRGSRFAVTIEAFAASAADAIDEPRAPLPSARPAVETVLEAGLSGRILLAEDVPSTQKLYAVYLSKAGAEVSVADDGEAAVAMALAAGASGQPYDLVLMDMQMPVLDGYRATSKLREAGYATPIVALTAHAMKGDRERCLAAGCDDYAAKPIRRLELIDLCRSTLARAARRAAAPEGA